MLINELKIKSNNRNKKRVGRGGKRGTFSGRGVKGQNARAGNSKRPAERDLLQRLPKLRGYYNRNTAIPPIVLNVSDLDKMGLETVSFETLKKKGIFKKSNKPKIKILGQGKLDKKVTVVGIAVSKVAAEKIKAAGGIIN